MHHRDLSRREFLHKSAWGAASALAAARLARGESAKESPLERTAVDLVPLGKTGLNICRLGIGTGSHGGRIQRELGPEGFTRLVRHGYDRGIRFIDTADSYGTHTLVRDAIRGLPREKLWIQTKIRWQPQHLEEGVEKCLERFLRELGTEYVDSLLIHCATEPTWPDDLKPLRDALSQAKEKKRLRLHGVSCHGLPGLAAAAGCDWVDVHLCRVNPQGRHVDGTFGRWNEPGKTDEAFAAIRAMHAKGRGIVGMKIIGNGDFEKAEDRERSIRFAMNCGFLDAAVIGFKSAAEIDEAIERMNRALALG